MEKQKTTERFGYIYNKKTAEGFENMKKHGIPKPLFSLQSKLAKSVDFRFKKMLRSLLKQIKAKMKERNISLTTDERGSDEDENLADLMNFFEEQGRLLHESEEIAKRENMRYIAEELEREWIDSEREELERLDDVYTGDIDENFRPLLEKVFKQEQADYYERLKADSSVRFKNILESMEINKDEFFSQQSQAVRTLYIQNSLERLQGETDFLKRRIIKEIIDYAEGKTDKLNIDTLARACFDSSNTLSKLFARDQMQRFNKACTLATFSSAKVKRVKWITSHDGRVRPTHKALDGKIFNVDDLPKEVDDYNCRCGLVPVEYED
jgi:SPP1 gp7 family putative phage head morphogenesis protein